MKTLFFKASLNTAKFCLLLACFLFAARFEGNAQSYPSSCGLGVSIPNNSCAVAPLIYQIPVGGAAGSQMGVDIALARVDIVISHTFDADLEIYLQSPFGSAVELSVGNGFGGNNFGDPLDSFCASVTSFTRSAMLSITTGSAPFIGSFRPQGDFSNFDDGTDPNGNWSLIICDGFPADSGTLEFVSLHFALPCGQPSFTGLQAQHCPNDNPDTLLGTPAGGVFSGIGVNTFGETRDTFNYTGSPVAIMDTATVEASQTVTGISGVLGEDALLESVCFKIQHSYVEDLLVSLISPDNDSIVLTSEPCGNFSDLDVCIVPGAGNSMDNAVCSNSSPALSGSFTASSDNGHDLGFFNTTSASPNGVWKLKVQDAVFGVTGQIEEFSLNFRSLGTTTFHPGVAGTGAHNITYTFIGPNGCTDSSTISTSVVNAPVMTITPDTSVCRGGNLLLAASGGVSYNWNNGATTDAITVNPPVNTDYSVTITDGNGCSADDTVTVTVFPPVTIDAGLNHAICSGQADTLTATGGVNYSWSTGDVVQSIVVTPVVLTTYRVTATDANGCMANDSVVVDVHQNPTAIQGPDEEICVHDTAIIAASGGTAYTWSDGVITMVGARPVNPLVTTIYHVTVTDGNGCSDTTSVTVSVHPLPVVTMAGLDAAYCNNAQPDTLSGTPADGFFAGAAMTGNVFSPPLLSPGTHTITYTFIDSFGCQASDDRHVLIHQAPLNTFIIGLSPDYCVDTIAIPLSGSPANGAFSGPGISGNTFIPYYAGPGTHDIIYTYNSGGICAGRDTQTVLVRAVPAVSIAGLDEAYCRDGSPDSIIGVPPGGTITGRGIFGDVFYPDLAEVGAPSIIRYEYFDSFGCRGEAESITTVYNNPEPVIINPGLLCVNGGMAPLAGSPPGGTFSGVGISNNMMVTALAGVGVHKVDYVYVDPRGCTGDTTLSITIKDVPEVTLSGLDSEYCFDHAAVTMSGLPEGGYFSGEGVVGFSFNPSQAQTGGPYHITYTYTDQDGCIATDTQSVTVNNSPFLVLSGLEELYCIHDAPVAIHVLPAGGTLLGAGVSNEMFDPQSAGIGAHVITYTYANSAGCAALDRASVTVEACVGLNDPDLENKVEVYPNPTEGKFTIEATGLDNEHAVARIYNMTGKLMIEEDFSSEKNYAREFDLSLFPKGVYYLRINFSSGMVVKKVVVQ